MTFKSSGPEIPEGAIICPVFCICGILLFTIPPLGFGLWVLFIIFYSRIKEGLEHNMPDDKSMTITIEDVQEPQSGIDTIKIPAMCPTCGNPIRLDTLKWVDADTGLCPHCEAVIEPV
jgi:hypothetical protein